MSSRYEELETQAVARVNTALPGVFLHVAFSKTGMEFEVPDGQFPACLFFWRGTKDSQSMAVAGVMRTRAKIVLGALVIHKTGDLTQSSSKKEYEVAEKLRGVITGFQPILNDTEAVFPIEEGDEWPATLDTGEYATYMEWHVPVIFARGALW